MRRLLPLLCLLVACTAARDRRQERLESDAEVAQADEAIAALSIDDALLAVATVRDRREGAQTLTPLLRHRDDRVRREAVRALGLVGDPALLPVLVDALQDVATEVQREAAFALSLVWGWHLAPLERLGVEARVEAAVLAALDEAAEDLQRGRGDEVRAASLTRALGEVGGADQLWATLGDAAMPPSVRAEALLALGRRAKNGQVAPSTEAQRALIQAAGPEPRLLLAADWFLARATPDDPAASEQLVLERLTTATGERRRWLLRALGHGVTPPGMMALQAAVTANRDERIAAVRAAARLGANGVPVLKLALATDDPLAHAEALPALAEHEPTTVAAWAEPALRLSALAGVPEPATFLPDALEGAAAEDPRVRAAAYELLAAIPGSEALAALLQADEDQPGPILAVAQALAAREDDGAEGWLIAAIDGEDPVVGAIAAEALGKRQGSHITARLVAAFTAHPDDADWERRLALVEAALPRKDVDTGFARAALKDPSPHVRLAAWRAVAVKAGQSKTGLPPQAWTTEPPPDPWFGVDDVERAVVTTSRGELTFVLYPRVAPATVASFVRLAESGFYDGLLFHRHVPDFVIQGGDPTGTGWGGTGYLLRDEFSPLPYARGTLGMARSLPDTAGSQWFVALSRQPHLDGHYTAFGQLVSGWDALQALRRDDTIESITIGRRPR